MVISATKARIAGIANEAALRIARDDQLDQRITTEEANREALGNALADETSQRVAADVALGTRLDTLGARVDAIGDSKEPLAI